MNLTDVISNAGLSDFARVGFVLSGLTFVGVVVWVMVRPKSEMQARAGVVLDDDEGASRNGRQS